MRRKAFNPRIVQETHNRIVGAKLFSLEQALRRKGLRLDWDMLLAAKERDVFYLANGNGVELVARASLRGATCAWGWQFMTPKEYIGVEND